MDIHVKKNVPLKMPNIILPPKDCVPLACGRCNGRAWVVVVRPKNDTAQVHELVCRDCDFVQRVDDHGRVGGKYELRERGAGRVKG